ncbi:MAG TPA: glutathione S-transferase [Casimicrobiaceae bacterium]|nr:glutathione S-transferase [Casimicrobiaceae bacterium]
MKLIGMLDSPYVRRVAISLQLLRLPFEHQSLSVFRTFAQFREINPVVKAPTLVCDDGEVLMDSTLILEYAEALAHPRSLMPRDQAALQHELRLLGLALAACEKAVQIVYERNQRPAEKRHEPWLQRVSVQLLAAFEGLEEALARRALPLASAALRQADVTVAVAWHFAREMIPDVIPGEKFPRLVAFSEAAERLPEFRAAPYGASTYTPSKAA